MGRYTLKKLIPVYCFVLVVMLLLSFGISRAVRQVHQTSPVGTGMTVIIDAGHGLPDGGTTSCTGALEADLNLEISHRLNDLFHLFGINTVMTRTSRDSVYTEGDSIAKKKISDTRNRVAMINKTDNAILLSIHQNHFYDSQYSGAQVFYRNNEESKELANILQSDLVSRLNPDSRRKSKKSTGVYIMEHVQCTGVLIECGFLSNQQEENLLRSQEYQKKLCAVIATSCLSYMNQNSLS
jgi:N-acetylmuramoyl-L-alanine amidase